MNVPPLIISSILMLAFDSFLFRCFVYIPRKILDNKTVPGWHRRNYWLVGLAVSTAVIAFVAASANAMFDAGCRLWLYAYYIFTLIQLLVLFVIFMGFPPDVMLPILKQGMLCSHNSQINLNLLSVWSWSARKSLDLVVYTVMFLLPVVFVWLVYLLLKG